MFLRTEISRRTSLVLCLTLALTLTYVTMASAQTKITMWGHSHAEANKYIQKLAEQYLKEFQIEVEFTIKSPDATMVALVAGAGPDIFEVHIEPFVYAQMGFAQPMTPDIAKALGLSSPDAFLERYFPHNRQFVSYEGAPIAVYRQLNTFGLALSKKAFEDTGYDTNRLHETLNWWSEVIKVARRLTQVNAEGKLTRLGFYLAEPSWGGFWAGVLPLQSLVYQAGGTLTTSDGKQATLDTPAVHRALDNWRQLGEAQSGFRTRIGGWNGLVTGTYAMMQGALISPQSAIAGMGDKASLDDVKLVPTPLLENATERFALDQPHYFMVYQKSQNAEEAWRFLDWMTSGDRLIGWFQEVGYFFPQFELQKYAVTQLSRRPDDPAIKHLIEVINWQGSSLPPFPGTAVDSKGPASAILMRAVDAAYKNSAPISKIAADANTELNSFLAGGK